MQMGYNSDVRHEGVIVHIQTEDRGINAAKIETQVFFSGTILDSRVLSYSELVESSESEEQLSNEIQRRMKALHKYFHNQIHRGTYDHRLPISDEAAAASPKKKAASPPAPSPDKTPVAAATKASSPPAPVSSGRASAFLGVDNPNNTTLADALLVALA